MSFFGCCSKDNGPTEDQAEPARKVKSAEKQHSSSASAITPVAQNRASTESKPRSMRMSIVNDARLAQEEPPADSAPVTQKEASVDLTLEETSLWDQAYGQLDKSLMEEYEMLLSKELLATNPETKCHNNDSGGKTLPPSRVSADPKIRAEQLNRIMSKGSEKLQQGRVSYTIFGREFVLEEQIADAANFLLWGKSLIDEAVKASSEASLAWVGVCLVLPLLTHPQEASDASEAGFGYVTSCLKYYTALEPSIFGPDARMSEDMKTALTENVIGLYCAILEYQVKTVLRVYKGSMRRWASDVRNSKSWGEMVQNIEQIVARLHTQLLEVQSSAMTGSLDDISKEATVMAERMKGLLHVSQEQLDVLKETRDIQKDSHNLQKYGMRIEHSALYDGKGVGSTPCQQNTRISILKEIKDWANSGGSESMFWLNGPAGTGKSSIAQSIAHHFAGTGQLGGSFFFKRSVGRSKADHLVPTLASALIHSIPLLDTYVYQSIDAQRSSVDTEGIERKALPTQFETLISKPLEALSKNSSVSWTRVLVIDAFDECDGYEDKRIICQWLLKLCQLPKIRLYILLTSRDEDPIGPTLRKSKDKGLTRTRSILDTKNSGQDIRAYLETCLESIKENRDDYREPWPSSQDVDRLYLLATTPSPLFIYVATFYRLLLADSSELLQDQIDNWLSKKHEGTQLAKTYAPVMQRVLFIRDEETGEIKRISREVEDVLNKILSAVILLAVPQSYKDIANLLDLRELVVEKWIKKLGAVLFIGNDLDNTVRAFHTSFQDYLLQDTRTKDIGFKVDERASHKMLAERCLVVMRSRLKRDICEIKDPDARINVASLEEVKTHLPSEAQYACLYWVWHTEKGGAALHEDDLRFLETHFLHWLEAMAWMRKMSEAVVAVTTLERIVTDSNVPDLYNFVHDMKKFILYARPTIEEAPLLIYHSSILFAPSKSLVSQSYARTEQKKLPKRIGQDGWTALVSVLRGHTDMVRSLAYSPMTKLLASGGVDGNIRIWNPANASQVLMLNGYGDAVRDIAYTPDGTQLASVSSSGAVIVWDAGIGEVIYKLNVSHYREKATCVAISRRGDLMAIGQADGCIQIRQVANGDAMQKPLRYSINGSASKDQIRAMAFSPTEGKLAVIQQGATVLWDTDVGKVIWSHEDQQMRSSNNAISFSSDGASLAVTKGRGAELFDVSTGKLRDDSLYTSLLSPVDVQIAAYSPFSPNLLALLGYNGLRQLWDTSVGRVALLKEWHVPVYDDRFASLVFIDGQRQLATAASTAINLWDISPSKVRENTNGHVAYVTDVRISPQLDIVASVCEDVVVIWDAINGSLLHRLEDSSGFFQLAISPDGKSLAGWGPDKIAIWDPYTGRPLQRVQLGESSISKLRFISNGVLLASLPNTHLGKQTVRLHSLETGLREIPLEGANEHIGSCTFTFSADARQLVIGSRNKISVCDTSSGKRLREIDLISLQGGTGTAPEIDEDDDYDDDDFEDAEVADVSHVTMSPDGTSLALVMYDGLAQTIYHWDFNHADSFQQLHVETWITVIALSLNGLLAALLEPRTLEAVNGRYDVTLWKAAGFQELGCIPWRSFHLAESLAFSDDGSSLISNYGRFNVEPLSAGLVLSGNWICHGAEKLVRLPDDLNPGISDFRDDVFVFSGDSGKVFILDCRT